MGKTIRNAVRVRRELAKYGSELPQFPCVLREDGVLAIQPSYLNAIRGEKYDLGSDAQAIVRSKGIPSKTQLLEQLYIETSTDTLHQKSSHGQVVFGVLRLPRSDAHLAIKYMPASDMAVSNSAYVDPYAAWLGSQMVTKQKSPSFIQLYGTFLCKDSYGQTMVAMISERMLDKLDEKVQQYISDRPVNWKGLISIILQVMLALCHAHSLTLVHNDAHLGNFMCTTTCADAPLYVNVKGRILKIPMEYRVTLMDFGRCSISSAVDEGKTTNRLYSSELKKFKDWEYDNPGADVTHFLAMLMLSQPSERLLAKEAEKPDAPPELRALVRLLQSSLQCSTGTDMFDKYDSCNTEQLKDKHCECTKTLIHKLRSKGEGCKGLLPIDWLSDEELTAPFVVTEPVPVTETVYSTNPLRALGL